MSELQALTSDLLIHVAQTLQVPMKGLLATIELLDESATVPAAVTVSSEVIQ
jgi:uncharacterized protein